MQRIKSHPEYYLQVVPEDEKPHWPKTDEELTVGSQSIEGGFTQYWAYPASLDKDPEELPEAEELAQKNPTSTPAILVDERPSSQAPVVLILTKDGHAWAKTESDIANLEENINSIVDFAKQKFHYKVEHFMTTSRVSKEIEKKLDSVDEDPGVQDNELVEEKTAVSGAEAEEVEPTLETHGKIDRGNTQIPTSGVYMQNSEPSSKLTMILIIIVILALLGGAVYFRQKIFNKLGLNGASLIQSESTPTPSPELSPTGTPTPTPVTLDRSSFKVKVLNGTSQSGLAATVSDSLKAKGWNTVGVGNATSSTIEQTQVRVKSSGGDAGKVMVADLASDYQASVSADLAKTASYDVEVIVGKK